MPPLLSHSSGLRNKSAGRNSRQKFSDKFESLRPEFGLKLSEPSDLWEKVAEELSDDFINVSGITENRMGEEMISVADQNIPEELIEELGLTDQIINSGHELEESIKNDLETYLNKDLSNIQIHLGKDADRITVQNNAKALTIGNHIFFREGEYAPQTDEGRKLIAHEVAHTFLQGGANTDMLLRQKYNNFDEDGYKSDSVKVVNLKTWKPTDDDEYMLHLVSDDNKHYFVSGTGKIYTSSKRAIAGQPNVGSGQSNVFWINDKKGGEGIMFDAGAGKTMGNNVVLYKASLELIKSELGISKIVGIHLSHGHKDHYNRIEIVVIDERLTPQTLIIENTLLYNESLRDVFKKLAENPKTAGLGFENFTGQSNLRALREGSNIFTAKFEYDELTFEYFVAQESVTDLQKQIKDFQKGERRSVDGKKEDSFSPLVKIALLGSSFRMIVMNDQRGSDYLKIYNEMEKESPGSFKTLFEKVEIIMGFQHHLGSIYNKNDAEGISRVLEVTLYQTGQLTVTVQSAEHQRNLGLVNRLLALGVDVIIVGEGEEKKKGGAVISSDNTVELIGPDQKLYKGNTDARERNARIGQTVLNFNALEQQFYSLQKVVSENTDIGSESYKVSKAAFDLIQPIYNNKNILEKRTELQQKLSEQAKLFMTLEVLGKDLSKAKTKGKRTKIQSKIDENNARYVELNQDIDALLPEFELHIQNNPEIFEASVSQYLFIQKVGEFEELFAQARETGKPDIRLIELIQSISPAYFKELIEENSTSTDLVNRRIMESAVGQQEKNEWVEKSGFYPRPTPWGRLGVRTGGYLGAALMIYTDVIGPAMVDMTTVKNDNLAKSKSIVIWWLTKGGGVPTLEGIINNVFSSDQHIIGSSKEDNQDAVIQYLIEGKLDGLLIKGIDDKALDKFEIWASVNIKNLNDWMRYFVDDPLTSEVIKRDATKNIITDMVWSIHLCDWSPNSGVYFSDKAVFNWQPNTRLTKIMNVIGERVSANTNADLSETRKKVLDKTPTQPKPQNTSSGPSFSMRETNVPTRLLRIKDTATDRALYSLYDQQKITEDINSTIPSLGEPSFFELDKNTVDLIAYMSYIGETRMNLDVPTNTIIPFTIPDDYVIVSGAKFNTVSYLRTKKTYRYSTIPLMVDWYQSFLGGGNELGKEHQQLLDWARQQNFMGDAVKEGYLHISGSSSSYFYMPGWGINPEGLALIKKDSVEEVKTDPGQ
jgi:hypothetical protein